MLMPEVRARPPGLPRPQVVARGDLPGVRAVLVNGPDPPVRNVTVADSPGRAPQLRLPATSRS
jgi:hypothetical protein